MARRLEGGPPEALVERSQLIIQSPTHCFRENRTRKLQPCTDCEVVRVVINGPRVLAALNLFDKSLPCRELLIHRVRPAPPGFVKPSTSVKHRLVVLVRRLEVAHCLIFPHTNALGNAADGALT